MKKLIVLLAASCCILFAENDAAGSYRMTGLHVVYYDIARADVTVTVHDAYGIGIVVPVQDIPAGAIFNSTPNGPHGEPYLNAVGVNLNVTLNEDGTGAVTEGSYYPDINQENCISAVQVLPITDDLGYDADNATGSVVPATNILGLPSNSPRIGQSVGGLGLFQSEILDFFPMTEQPEKLPAVLPFVATTDGTLLAVSCGLACVTPQEALGGATLTDAVFGGDAGACIATCDAADPATALANFGGAGWMQGTAYGMYLRGDDIGESMAAGNVAPNFYLEWSALDGPNSESGLGDIIGEDEDGDGTDYDRIFGIPYTTVTTMNPACGFNLPIAGDVSALFPAECVDAVTTGNDFYLMDASLEPWGSFLTYNAATYQQVQGMCAQMGIDAATCDGYIAGNVPLADMDGDGVPETGFAYCLNDDSAVDFDPSCYATGATCEGRLHMQFDPTCVPQLEAREVMLEFVETGGCEANGDSNSDGTTNVLDIVATVANILGNGTLTDTGACNADVNADGTLNVLDIVATVQLILGGKTAADATSIEFNKSSAGVDFIANGYVGAIQMTISHDEDFSINLTNEALVADYNTTGSNTTLIVVAPSGSSLFTSQGNFEIVDVVAADSENYINAAVNNPASFVISKAYPNPFNPTTSLDVSLNNDAQVKVEVYNVMGQLVDVIANDMMSQGTHNFTWNASDVPSGAYFIRTQVGSSIDNQKITLVK